MKRRPVHLNAVQRAIGGAAKLPADGVQEITRAIAAALHSFIKASDCRLNWRCMADALNVAEELAARGICSDEPSRQLILGGQQVLADVYGRREAGGSWTLHGPEIFLLSEALERHGIQLMFCSFREYEASIEAVRRKHAAYLAGSQTPKGATVVTGDIQ